MSEAICEALHPVHLGCSIWTMELWDSPEKIFVGAGDRKLVGDLRGVELKLLPRKCALTILGHTS